MNAHCLSEAQISGVCYDQGCHNFDRPGGKPLQRERLERVPEGAVSLGSRGSFLTREEEWTASRQE